MLMLILLTLYRFWVVCADMAAQYSVPDPTTPGKMFMNYQGLASYLSSGGQKTLMCPLSHLYPLLSHESFDSYLFFIKVTTTGSLTPTTTTMLSPTLAALWRMMAHARMAMPWSSHATPVACLLQSSASSARNKTRSAWLVSSSPSCSLVSPLTEVRLSI